MKQLILASASPRRQQLLQECDIPFIAIPADIDETINPNNALEEEVKDLSFRKASAILESHPDAIVIGSDTIVVIDQTVLGKPEDQAHAKKMLEMLSDHTHQVMTGVCILSKQRKYCACVTSDVTFAKLSDEEIEAYIQTGECDDKAGAYAIQGHASKFIKNINGDYYAIMGLPLHLIYEELKNIDFY